MTSWSQHQDFCATRREIVYTHQQYDERLSRGSMTTAENPLSSQQQRLVIVLMLARHIMLIYPLLGHGHRAPRYGPPSVHLFLLLLLLVISRLPLYTCAFFGILSSFFALSLSLRAPNNNVAIIYTHQKPKHKDFNFFFFF